MASSKCSSVTLDLKQLIDVIDVLNRCNFPDTKWFSLGLRLGLLKTTLDAIKSNYRTEDDCLTECLSKWLSKADNVVGRGGDPSWDTLSNALRAMNEIAVADKLHLERALAILSNHDPLLSQSLSDPIRVTRLLYGEHIITRTVLDNVESTGQSLSERRKVLLAAVREAVRINYQSLQTFGTVLCKFTGNVQLGKAILSDYAKAFPDNRPQEQVEIAQYVQEGSVELSDKAMVSSSTPSAIIPPAHAIKIPVLQSMNVQFSSIRVSFAKMFFNVCQAIKRTPPPLNNLKEFLICFNNGLIPQLDNTEDLSNVLLMIEQECTLIDIEILEAVVQQFVITEAEIYIDEYKTILKEFCDTMSVELCLQETFQTGTTHPSLRCETVTYVFDWEPEKCRLKDITDILSKISGRLVKIQYIDTGRSVTVTCTFPLFLTGCLITEVTENFKLIGLKELIIGNYTIWKREENQEVRLLEEKIQLLTQQLAVYSSEDDSTNSYKTMNMKMLHHIEQLKSTLKAQRDSTAKLELSLARSKDDIVRLQEKIFSQSAQLLDKDKEIEQLRKQKKDETYKKLHGAVVNGDIAHLVQLIKEGADVNIKFQPESDIYSLSKSESLLHLAVDAGQHSVLRALINLKADVNIIDKAGKTPLYYAILLGYEDMVQTLLDHGANIDESGSSSLHYLVENDQVRAIERMLANGVDGDVTDKYGNTPLHSAIKGDKINVIEALLKHGVDSTIKNKQGWSPLYLAAMENETAFGILLRCGVRTDYLDQAQQRTDLHYAACHGHTNAVNVFLKHEFDVNILDKELKTPLHLAAEHGYEDIVDRLLSHETALVTKDLYDKAPLHYAAENGHSKVVCVLNDYGADVNIVDKENKTPLSLAAGNGHLSVVQKLLEFQADATIKDKEGWTPLNQAVWNGHNETVEELIKHSHTVLNDADTGEWTAVQHAVRRGHADILRTLVSHGVDIDIEEGEWTLLHVAAQRGHAKVAEVLLEIGFNVDVQDENGWSAFSAALVKAHPEVVKTMMKYNVNAKGQEDGRSPIHHAVDSLNLPGRHAVVELLLAYEDVDPNTSDSNGMTPLHYAVNREYVDVARLLLENGADPNKQDKDGETPLDLAKDNDSMLKVFQEFIK